MSKKRQKSGKNRRSKAGSSKLQQVSVPSTQLRISPLAFWTRQFILITTVIAGSIIVFTALLTDWYDETPPGVKWGMNIAALIISGIRLRETIRGHKNKAYQISKKSAVVDAVLVGLLFVILSIPILRGTGAIEILSNWVLSVLPFVSQALSRVIAWVLTFAIPSAISGVIGNYVYDVLKKLASAKVSKDSKDN